MINFLKQNGEEDMKNKKVMEYSMQDWPLSDAYLIELGRITALWSSLEGLVNICIGKLAGYDTIEDVRPFILVNHGYFFTYSSGNS